MALTIDILHAWFRQFNADYFGDELPVPRILLSKARTRLGTMSYRRVRKLLRWTYTDFTIRISTYYECSEREYQETLLHEMIHYYIGVNKLKDTSAHGQIFRDMMNTINEKYGRHLTISHKCTNEQKSYFRKSDQFEDEQYLNHIFDSYRLQ